MSRALAVALPLFVAMAAEATPPPPIVAKAVRADVVGAHTVLVMDKGSDVGVQRGWKGCLLTGAGDACISGMKFVIERASPKQSFAKLSVNHMAVVKSGRFRLWPP